MKNEFDASKFYDIYSVTVRFRDKLCGGTPKNPALIRGWVEARTGHNDDLTTKQTEEAINDLVEAKEERSWNGFQGDENGLFIKANNVKAMLREGATMLRIMVDKRGSKQILREGEEVKALDRGSKLYLAGKKAPDGYDESPIHVQTAQGPRTALKRIDYVSQIELSFQIWIFATQHAETRHVSEEDVKAMLTFCQESGMGADRSQGSGKFDVVDFQVIQKAVPARAPSAPKKDKKEKEIAQA